MIRQLAVGLVLLACSTGAPLVAAERFDGHWQGRATLIVGAPGCPTLLDFRVSFAGGRITGIATRGGTDFEIEGRLIGPAKIKVIGYGSIGLATFTARFRNGEWRGGWEAEGECNGDRYLERVE